jgi:hypothetical protein
MSSSAGSPRTGLIIALSVAAILGVLGGIGAIVILTSNDRPGTFSAPAATTPPTLPPEPSPTAAPDQPATMATLDAVLTLSEEGTEVATLRVGRPVLSAAQPKHLGQVSFRVTYVAKARFNYNALYMFVVDGADRHYDVVLQREPALHSGMLYPGQRISGWVSFAAPEHAILVYAPEGGAGVVGWRY